MLFVGCFALFSRDVMPGEDLQGGGAAGAEQLQRAEVRAAGCLSALFAFFSDQSFEQYSQLKTFAFILIMLACCHALNM